MGLKAHEYSLLDMLSGYRRYSIPNFQREYSWTTQEALQLAEDLLDAWRREDESYFLGSVVVVRSDDAEHFQVIDGQQRLTTLSLMFAVLRDLNEKPKYRKAITELLETEGSITRDIVESPRVLLRDVDQPFMFRFVQGDDFPSLLELVPEQLPTAAQRNILENVRALVRLLSDELERRDRWTFFKYVSRHAFMVLVETDDYESAHRIFGVMNTRGMPLTAADIFKSRVVGGLPEPMRDEYAARWEAAIETAGADPDEFFRELLVISSKSLGRRALIADFPSQVLEGRYEGERGAEFIDEVMLPFAQVNRFVRGDAAHGHERVDRALRRLQQYPGDEWRPFAMWALRTVEQPDELAGVLEGLERITGVGVTAGLSRQAREQQAIALLRAAETAVRELGALDPERLAAIDDQTRKKAVQHLKGEVKKGRLPLIWLTRAHERLTGQFIDTRRGIAIMSLLPVGAERLGRWGVDPALAEFWRPRLGAMLLTRERRRRGPGDTSFEAFSARLVPAHGDLESAATAVRRPGQRWDARVLQARQDELVVALAEFWGIRFDSEGVDLTRLSESRLLSAAGGIGDFRSRRIRLRDVMEVGLVDPGDVFVWVRRKRGETFRIAVTEDHRFELPDGRLVDSPSAAVAGVSDASAQGLDVWVRESDGRTLRDLWDVYRRRFSAGDRS